MKSFQLAEKSFLKFLLIMKLTVVFILFFALNASADGFGQGKLSLNFKKTEIANILTTIEKQTSYRFLYNNDLADLKQKVNLSVKDAELKEVLDAIFAKTDLAYQFMENNLVVIKEAGGPEASYELQATITGKVTGEGDSALSGVTVQVKGTNRGTTTNAQGAYSINATENDVLVFSYVGYETQEQAVGNKTEINVALVAAKTNLEQVVVIGYGTASKRDLTGSIAKVEGKEIADKPNANPVSSLQSKVAGLSVVTSGTPGKAPDVRIRGTISIGSVAPLYLVDGIFTSSIDYLNPNDIESIEVLKDPSSLAIFGVRGAPGVIAITTKKAKAGQVIINVNSSYGFKDLTDKIEMANADEFKMLLAEEGQNRYNETQATAINDFIATSLPSWTGNTDWVDALTRTAHFTTNNISFAGSTDRNKLYMGVGYSLDEGLVKHIQYERLNLSVNDEFKLSKSIKFGFNFIGSREELPYDGAVGELAQAKRVAPIVPSGTTPVFTQNPYGTDSAEYNLYYTVPVIQNTLNNPLGELENNWNKTIDVRYRTLGNAFVEINFLRHFTFRSTLYADMSNEDKRVYTPLYNQFDPSINSVVAVNQLTGVTQEKIEQKSFQQDEILTYKNKFGDHSLSVTAGFTTYYAYFSMLHDEVKQKSGTDPIPDNKRFWYVSNGFGIPAPGYSDQYESATLSGLVRALYNFRNKYYLNGSFRRDGSSLIYNPDTRYQSFWAVGAAWEISREDFMANQKFFDYLKIKGSIGVLGNQNTYNTRYPYFPTISQGNTAVFGNSVFPSFSNNYLVDKNLQWETVHSKEVGFEFTALTNRLHGEIVYYDKQTKDMLTYLRPPGVLPTLGNFGSVSNKGFEFTAGWDQKLSKDFSFSVSANLTTYKNKVTKLDYPLPADEQFPNQTQVGYPIGYFYGYVVEGVYQSYADKLSSPVFTEFAVGPGDLKYKDINGDGKIDADDKTIIGNPTPDFTYGGSIGLNYKNFNLGIDVSGVYGNEIYRYWNTSENIFSVYNYPKYALNRWHGPGTSNWVPILDQTHKVNRVASTFGIEDGSYFRIRNIQLGYNFNPALLSRIHIKSAKIFVNVQNLKTWRNNLGYSPEFAGTETNGQPATSFGIDIGDANSAIPRIITAGINVTF